MVHMARHPRSSLLSSPQLAAAQVRHSGTEAEASRRREFEAVETVSSLMLTRAILIKGAS